MWRLGEPQTEEARATNRLDPRIDTLQRPPVDLRPDVDAKGRLKRRPPGPRRAAIQRNGQPPLMCPVRRVLKDREHHGVSRRLDRRGMVGHSLGPALGYPGDMRQKRLLPDQPDREKVGHCPVRLARQLGLPEKPTRMLRPATEIEVEPVKCRFRRRRVEPQRLGCAQNRALRCVGRLGNVGTESREPSDLGRQVVHRPGPPGSEGPRARRGRPERLPPVELPASPEPDRLLDDRRPVGARGFGGEIGNGRQRRDRAFGAGRHPLQRRDVRGLQRR